MALVLVGDAGIGKSTLWRAGVAAARSRGHVVLDSRPTAAEMGLAHVVVGDLFGDVASRVLPALPPPRRRALEQALLIGDAPDDPIDPRTLGVAIHSGPRAPRPRWPAPGRDRRRPVGRQLIGRGRRVRPQAINRRRCPAVACATLPCGDIVDDAGGCAGSVGARAPDRRAARRGRHRIAAPAAPGHDAPAPDGAAAPRGLGVATRSMRSRWPGASTHPMGVPIRRSNSPSRHRSSWPSPAIRRIRNPRPDRPCCSSQCTGGCRRTSSGPPASRPMRWTRPCGTGSSSGRAMRSASPTRSSPPPSIRQRHAMSDVVRTRSSPRSVNDPIDRASPPRARHRVAGCGRRRRPRGGRDAGPSDEAGPSRRPSSRTTRFASTPPDAFDDRERRAITAANAARGSG